jgi:predicted GNAT family acetyltransferase
VSERPRIDVADSPDNRRYEAYVEGEVAGYVFYQARPDRLVLTSTHVLDEFEGQGVGSRLVAATLDDIRRRGLSVEPLCPFAAAYIERHPEFADLVTAY